MQDSLAQISAERWGVATEDEVAAHVHVVFPLPMGMERRTDVSEPACRLGRGPRHHKHDKFGVSQAATN